MAKQDQAGADAAPAVEVDARGQSTLPLDGQNYLQRPSHEAILAIERELGPLFGLSLQATHGNLTLDQMSVVAAEFMKAVHRSDPESGADYRAPSPAKLSKLIYEAGAPRICARLAVILTGAVNGGYTAEGEAKAGTP